MELIIECRLCQSPDLVEAINLGEMSFSGVFPETLADKIPTGKLRVVLCNSCKLAQLDRNFPSNLMYGDNYGYMSSLNQSMIDHLSAKAKHLSQLGKLKHSDIVVDIGSNDGTLINSYEVENLTKVAIDPTISKYKLRYKSNTILISDFFSAEQFEMVCGKQKAKVVSSIAMFYDLPDPLKFAQDVKKILCEDGYWHLEVSYGPWMLRSGAFDAICHEHTEYYSLLTLKNLLNTAGFEILECDLNSINGGSIAITATPKENESNLQEISKKVSKFLDDEKEFNNIEAWQHFSNLVNQRVDRVLAILRDLKNKKKVVDALGASTKGNILLQAIGNEARDLIRQIGEVNEYKFDRYTPGTLIPIVPESEVLRGKPDFIVILPWHFRDGFEKKLIGFIEEGGSVIYPLPELEIQN